MNSLNRDTKPNGWEEDIIKKAEKYVRQNAVYYGNDAYRLQMKDWLYFVRGAIHQAILSAEERAVRDLITSVGYRVETVLGYLEMGKTEEAIKHLENIHELFVTKQK